MKSKKWREAVPQRANYTLGRSQLFDGRMSLESTQFEWRFELGEDCSETRNRTILVHSVADIFSAPKPVLDPANHMPPGALNAFMEFTATAARGCGLNLR